MEKSGEMILQTFCDTRWKLEVGNNVDPDDGKSMVCKACRLPIFSTPFVTTTTNDHMHDQCADLDHHLLQRLKGYPLHPTKDLVLRQQDSTTHERSCSRCNSICGSRFYACFDCDFRLDLACAVRIRIQHRSHGHRLEAIKAPSFSFTCAACGTQHTNQGATAAAGPRKYCYNPEGLAAAWDLSYVCVPCGFMIHPDCALLPNAIILDDDKHHQHPLLLTYHGQNKDILRGLWQTKPTNFVCHACSICDGHESEGFGFYGCYPCHYYAHIKCVIYSDPDHCSFKPVFLRDAQVPNLIRLPLPNDHASVVSRILTNQTTDITSGRGGDYRVPHEHPLILQEHSHDDDGVSRVCSACVQLISPTDGPFYSCKNNNNNNNEFEAGAGPCRDLFFHKCCAHLPATLTDSGSTTPTLVDKSMDPFNMCVCSICNRPCNRLTYRYMSPGGYYYYKDVVCALMSSVIIIHDAHAKSHFLQCLWVSRTQTNCCRGEDIGSQRLGYGCTNCHNFYIHIKCALLPDTVNHKFDRHPLKLITTSDNDQEEEESKFCEICEKDLDRKTWYYYCDTCDQSFHSRCIPCLDRLSKIKFGFTVRVEGHDCPLTCVRGLTVAGYKCSHCGQTIDERFDEIAFECSECYFRIHEMCAEELLLP